MVFAFHRNMLYLPTNVLFTLKVIKHGISAEFIGYDLVQMAFIHLGP